MKFSSWPVSVCSLAATIPMAMDGSKLGPSFFTSAGRQGKETGISWAVSVTGQGLGLPGTRVAPGPQAGGRPNAPHQPSVAGRGIVPRTSIDRWGCGLLNRYSPYADQGAPRVYLRGNRVE